MYQEINARLSQSQQQVYQLEKTQTMLARLQEELAALERKAGEAKERLDIETHDYEKLTQKNTSTLLYSLLGRLEDRTEKERLAAMEAELTYHQYLGQLEDMRRQIEKLKQETFLRAHAPREYDQLCQEKLQLLQQTSGQAAQQIMKLNECLSLSEQNQREIKEALSSGNAVQTSLAEALKSLKSAAGWGIWDMMGGGFITDLVKHSHIDSASDTLRRTQSLLRFFKTELADVRISGDVQLDIGSFATFADFFFDGLFADFFVQRKIHVALQNVKDLETEVQNALDALHKLDQEEQTLQAQWQEELHRFIVDT